MTDVIRPVGLGHLGGPHPTLGGMLEIRFTNTLGQTEVWMVPNKPEVANFYSVLSAVEEHVKLAFLDSGVDSRIGLLTKQQEAFRDHIESHHDELTVLYRQRSGVRYNCQQFATPPNGGADAPSQA